MSTLPCRSCANVIEGTVRTSEVVDSHSGFSCKAGCVIKDSPLMTYGEEDQDAGFLICKFYLHEGFAW